MSSWSFSAKVDMSELIKLSKNFDEVSSAMLEVVEDVAIEVRNNIVKDNIIDTGALLDSITAEQRSVDLVVLRDGVEYGVYNEFGTSRMAARPFFTPAIEKFGKIFDQVFTRLLK